METAEVTHPARAPWNKGKLTGQKPPLKLPEIWAIRVRLQLSRLRQANGRLPARNSRPTKVGKG
jgi:hypothetical protein